MPWLRRLAAGLLLRCPGFEPSQVFAGSVESKAVLEQVSLRAIWVAIPLLSCWRKAFPTASLCVTSPILAGLPLLLDLNEKPPDPLFGLSIKILFLCFYY